MATWLSDHELRALVQAVPALEEFCDRFAVLGQLVRSYPALCEQLRAESHRRQQVELEQQRMRQELDAVRKQLHAIQAAAVA